MIPLAAKSPVRLFTNKKKHLVRIDLTFIQEVNYCQSEHESK